MLTYVCPYYTAEQATDSRHGLISACANKQISLGAIKFIFNQNSKVSTNGPQT